jgi:hypothetical protein
MVLKEIEDSILLAGAGAIGAVASPIITALFNRRRVDSDISKELLGISKGVAEQLQGRVEELYSRVQHLEEKDVENTKLILKLQHENAMLKVKLGNFNSGNGE